MGNFKSGFMYLRYFRTFVLKTNTGVREINRLGNNAMIMWGNSTCIDNENVKSKSCEQFLPLNSQNLLPTKISLFTVSGSIHCLNTLFVCPCCCEFIIYVEIFPHFTVCFFIVYFHTEY